MKFTPFAMLGMAALSLFGAPMDNEKQNNLTLQDAWYNRSIVSTGAKGPLEAFRAKWRSGKPIIYGAIGGSITEGAKADKPEERYCNRIATYLGAKLVNAGIGATGSLFGCYRAQKDLLKHNPDFITIEYAVNDRNDPAVKAGYEGLVRQCLALPSHPLVLLIFTVNQVGGNAQTQHIEVGRFYHLPMLSYRDAIWPEIAEGRHTWRDFSPDEVHPNSQGHGLIAAMVCRFLETAVATEENLPVTDIAAMAPQSPDALRYAAGALQDATNTTILQNDGWKTGPHRGGYTAFLSETPGAILKLEVEASEISLGFKRYAGAFGRAQVQIDNLPPQILEGYFPIPNENAWRGGHTQVNLLAKDLPLGKHTLTIRLLPDKHEKSTGHTFEIGYLLLAR